MMVSVRNKKSFDWHYKMNVHMLGPVLCIAFIDQEESCEQLIRQSIIIFSLEIENSEAFEDLGPTFADV
jgi:hypothetical protein